MKQNHFIQGKCQPLLPSTPSTKVSNRAVPAQRATLRPCSVSKCQRPSVPRALLGHSLPCISPKAKQIPDLDFKSVFYLRRIHLGNLYRHSTSWCFSGVAYNQRIVHWISEYYSKKITKVSEVAINTLYCSDKTTLPLRVFAAFSWGPDHPAGNTRTLGHP